MNNDNAGSRDVIIIEDEIHVCNICRRVLTREGFNVDVAYNGEVAQNIVVKKEYDCLLVDVRLPVVDGIEFYRWLQENYPRMVDRVVFTSGDVMARDTIDFVTNSGRPFIAKPFTPDQLKSVINDVVSNSG